MRLAVELFYIGLGLVVAVAVTSAAAWAYPPAYEVIFYCGAGAAAASILMGIGPLRLASRIDRPRS